MGDENRLHYVLYAGDLYSVVHQGGDPTAIGTRIVDPTMEDPNFDRQITSISDPEHILFLDLDLGVIQIAVQAFLGQDL